MKSVASKQDRFFLKLFIKPSAQHTLHEPINTTLKLAEDLHRELISQVLVPNGSGVQIVAGIVFRSKLTGNAGVGEELVKVGNCVKGAGVTDEVVDLLSMKSLVFVPLILFSGR